MTVRTRTAPSPTGRMHIGTVRTALFNYLFAKHHGGTFIVRIEDTDSERNKPEYEAAIWEDLAWCGLVADEQYRQSDLLENHVRAIRMLIDTNAAYVSKEPSQKDSSVIAEVVRLRNPNTTVFFTDLVRGDVSFDTTELGDFVIARSVEDPLYHLAVVVDDHDQHISHVLRAEEHISNTPRHILLQEALGYERPLYGHFPLVLAPDRSKLSKRRDAVGIDHFRDLGFLPEALINYLALLGWSSGDDRELFTLSELTERFDISRIQKGGAIFDIEKLRWFNREYLLKISAEDFAAYAVPVLEKALTERNVPVRREIGERLLPMLRERIAVTDDIRIAAAEGEFDYAFMKPQLNSAKIPNKRSDLSVAARHLRSVRKLLSDLSSSQCVDPHSVKAVVMPYAEHRGRGNVLWPLRYALTGREKSPDPFSVAALLGKDETLARIDTAITQLEHGA